MDSTAPTLAPLRRPWPIVAAVAVLALVGWAFFHPNFRPDTSAITPAMRQELAKTGFKSTQGVSAARLETVETIEGISDSWIIEQRIIAIDGLITEKQVRRRTTGMKEEGAGLYVGPLAVVRFNRVKPPIIGDLLPFQFWASSRMSEFVVEEADRFPTMKGGKLRARVTYEDRYAGGELLQVENRRLQCDVTNAVDAASVNPGLSGTAVRVDCREELEPNGRRVGAQNPQTVSQGRVAYAHWYILDRGWSIAAEGESAVRVSDIEGVRKWRSKVISFESTRD